MSNYRRNDAVSVKTTGFRALLGRVVYVSYSGKIGVRVYPRSSNPYLILAKPGQVARYEGAESIPELDTQKPV